MPGYMARAPQMLALILSNGGVLGVIYADTSEVKTLECDVLDYKKTVTSSQNKILPQGPCFSYHNAPHSSPFVVIACLRPVLPRRVDTVNLFLLLHDNPQQNS